MQRIVFRMLAGAMLAGVAPFAAAISPGVVITQLSDIQQPNGDAAGLKVSANGATLCFVADRDTDEANELFCSDSGNPQTATRISGLLPSGSAATYVTLSSDGSTVYYLAPELNGNKVELYRAPTDGSSAATRLNAQLLPPDGDVKSFELLEAQQKVIYSAAAETDNVFELYVVDLAMPGQATKLSGPVVASGAGVKQFRFDESTSRVYYTSEQQEVDKIELYGNALAGGALVKLNAPINSGEFIGSFGFIPGGAQIQYRVVPTTGPLNTWVASATQSGTAWRLNQTLQSNGSATVVTTSPDASRIVFVADATVDSRFGLYSRALDGSEPLPVTIDSAIIEFPPMTLNTLPRVDYLDDNTLLYVDAYNNDGIGKLVTRDDEAASSPTVLSGSLDVGDYRIAGNRGEAVVAYDAAGVSNLARVALDASGATPLTSIVANAGVIALSSIDPAGRYWVYLADPTVPDRRELFRIDLDAPGVTTLSSTASGFLGVNRASARSVVDGGWVCFDEDHFSSMTLISRWVLRCTGRTGVPVRDMAQMSASIISSGERNYSEILPAPDTPDRVFYAADIPNDDQYEAYQSEINTLLFANGFED